MQPPAASRFRFLAMLLLPTLLGACGLMPASQRQSFTVSGAVPSRAVTTNTDPHIDAVLSRQICVDSYQKLGQADLPADPGTLEQWHVRCTPYHPTLVAGIPLPSIW